MSSIVIAGDTSGSVTLQAPAVAGSTVITLPSTSTTLVSSQWTTSGANIFYNTGSVGVGAAPDSTFYVGGGALGTIRFFFNGTSVNYNDVDTQIWRTAGASEIMRLTSTGLRIGTTSSTSLGSTTYKGLFVNSGGNASIGVQGGTYTQPYYGQIWLSGGYGDGTTARTSGFFIRSQAVGGGGSIQNNLLFVAQTDNGVSESEYARIDSSGRFLIGTTSAINSETALSVYNASSANYVATIRNGRNVSGDTCLNLGVGSNCNNTSSYFLHGAVFGVANVIYIFGNGNIQNFNNSYGGISDVKLKENIVDASPKLADLMQVKVRNYNFIGNTTKQIGVVAQELETIFPAMVDETPDRDADNNVLETTTKSVKYSVFVPMLIKAIQEQQALITTLTDRISVLENK